jgi:hypothetical protein
MRSWMMPCVAGLIAMSACGGGDDADLAAAEAPRASTQAAAKPAPPPPPPPPMTAADSAALRARLAAKGDSVRAAFGRASALGAREVAELRQDRNAEQVASAQRLGIRVGAARERLAREGRIVALGDSTAWWILRDMDHSVPYVTPDARAMLEQLGRRFHARLDSLGLPRYRMKVTSALRTDETQAELRRINSYASQTVSAHEFGTTVDVSHERFAAPAGLAGGEMEAEVLDSIGKEYAKVLQAELGRALAALRDAGALHVMMENQQPVYHMTLARPFAATASTR